LKASSLQNYIRYFSFSAQKHLPTERCLAFHEHRMLKSLMALINIRTFLIHRNILINSIPDNKSQIRLQKSFNLKLKLDLDIAMLVSNQLSIKLKKLLGSHKTITKNLI
jgi:hypothetical protein